VLTGKIVSKQPYYYNKKVEPLNAFNNPNKTLVAFIL